LHVLGYESELQDASRIKLLVIAEGHRFECENRFAGFIHRFDRFLETRRRSCGPEVPSRIDNDCHAARHRCPTNPSNEGIGLSSYRADPDRIGFCLKTTVANIDIVTSVGEI